MAYCTNADLTLLTGTTLSTAVQDAIIDHVCGKIDARLRSKGLTPPASDDDLKAASLDLSHAAVLMHPRNPDGATRVKLADGDVARPVVEVVADLRKSGWAIVADYVTAQTAGTSPLPTIAIVGRRGVRVGEYDEMTTAEEDDY